MQWKVQKLNSDNLSSDHLRSDTNSDGSDYTVVTVYSDASSDGLYSVVVRSYSVYSVYSVNNHLDSVYSVVVRGLCELCVEFFIVYSVNQQWGPEGLCYVITLPKVTTIYEWFKHRGITIKARLDV